jgi:hypothetical protein
MTTVNARRWAGVEGERTEEGPVEFFEDLSDRRAASRYCQLSKIRVRKRDANYVRRIEQSAMIS